MNVPGIALHQTAETQLEMFLAAPTHAVLLGGPAGTGKTHVAESLAAQLLGVAEPALETHGYYRVITPTKGTITIEQIRDLLGFFRLKVPGQGIVKRVAILQDAETMGMEAQNALLKQLEEPPADSVLILTSSQPLKLLPTVRSRVQELHLGSPSETTLQAHFTAKGHTEAAIKGAILRAGANVADVERLLETGSGAPDETINLVKQVLGGTTYDRLLLVDGLSKQKEHAGEFVDTLATVAMASLNAAAAKGATTVKRWQTVLEAAQTAQDAFDRNGNAKLVLTELMLAL